MSTKECSSVLKDGSRFFVFFFFFCFFFFGGGGVGREKNVLQPDKFGIL